MATQYPKIGQWFQRPTGTLLEVVAIDEENGTVELQLFDGTIDEVDIEIWDDLQMAEACPPEDWSGSVDMDPEDYKGRSSGDMPAGFHDPLEHLNKG